METDILKIKAIPGSSKNEIVRIENNELVVKLKAQPEKGKANKELIKYFSKIFPFSKSDFSIKSGETSRHKVLIVPSEIFTLLHELGFKVDKNQ